jgi:hypothetical protein
MCRFTKCFEVTKGFSCFKMLGTMTLHVSSQAHLFPEPEHTLKRASDLMPRQSSQTVHRGMTYHHQHACSDYYELLVVILKK